MGSTPGKVMVAFNEPIAPVIASKGRNAARS